jgi:acetoacetyl-CoA synthetase
MSLLIQMLSIQGVLLQTKKDIRLGFGLSHDDTYFQYTTVSKFPNMSESLLQRDFFQTGWMMWTFMLTGLACGSRIILYDGSPFHPELKTYLKFISDQG